MAVNTWPSYVINLADNTARMDNARAQLAGMGLSFHRVDAVNGWQLPPDEIDRVYDRAANRAKARHDLVPAEIGCYLSHIEAWRTVAAGDAAGGFIFEDDFDADETLPDILAALSSDDIGDWDMVKLFTFDPDARQVSARPLGADYQMVVPYRVPTCLIGYALTKPAAAKLLERAVPFFRPVDEDQKYFWETGLRVALVLPAPIKVGDQQTVTGTIGSARRDAAKGGIARLWRGLRTQLAYQAVLRWHRARGVK